MTGAVALPPEVLSRFRVIGFERLERIDAAWRALTQGNGGVTTDEDELYRELHTLKGDARVVGYSEVGILCQRLEDLLAAARDRKYRVHEDVDIVVTMAIQFVGMLIRRHPGGAAAGIDIQGFLKQIESVTAEWLRRASALPMHAPGGRRARAAHLGHAAPSTRYRLGEHATSVYLEHLRASGAAVGRLREVWRGLVGTTNEIAMLSIEPYIAQTCASAAELARELDKEVDVSVEVADVIVSEELIETVNAIVLHLLRNAVDHGIEPPQLRGKKPRAGLLRVVGRVRGTEIELRVEDDGRGIDRTAVHARAVEKGLVNKGAAPTDAELLALVFQPGFSTRSEATQISGRGVGLDVVRAEVGKVSGSLSVESTPGSGTAFTVRLPRALDRMPVQHMRAACARFSMVVDASWDVVPTSRTDAPCITDLLDLPKDPSCRATQTIELRRGKERFVLQIRGVPEAATATRVCPTSTDARVEIVEIAGQEAILFRPERFASGS